MTEPAPTSDGVLVVRALGQAAVGGRPLFRVTRSGPATAEPQASVVSEPAAVLRLVEEWLSSLTGDRGPDAR